MRSRECIGQVQVRATLILHLIIIFLKSHHHNLKAFWRTREKLLQHGFQRLVVALDFHMASVGVLVKFLK